MAAGDLCTLAQVRAHRQFNTDDTTMDAVIGDLITRWSKAIMRYTRREFAPQSSAGTARRFIHDGSGRLDLAPYDIQTVTAVASLDVSGAVLSTLTSTTYELWPYPAPDSVFTHLELPRYAGKRIQVTGTWGFASVPEDVAEACILAVVMTMSQEIQLFGSAIQPNSIGDNVNAGLALPPGIRGILAPFKREP